MHNNRVCESDKDGDGAVAGDISDQGQASLRTLLQAVQDILLPKQHNNTLGLAPDVDNWIKTAKGLSHFRPVSSQDILLPKQYNSWIDLKPDIHLRADYRYTSSVQKTRLKKFEEKNLPFPLLHKIKKKSSIRKVGTPFRGGHASVCCNLDLRLGYVANLQTTKAI